MPSLTGLGRVARLAKMPETRKVVVAAARSGAVRDLARRAVHDRGGLVRDIRHPAISRDVVRGAIHHPATQELASAALLLLPGRYLPLGMVAAWATRRVLRRRRPQGADRTDPTGRFDNR